jgi:hypothetical protein
VSWEGGGGGGGGVQAAHGPSRKATAKPNPPCIIDFIDGERILDSRRALCSLKTRKELEVETVAPFIVGDCCRLVAKHL